PSATAHSAWSGQLATFSDADPNGATGDYPAVISWSDGQASPCTIGTSGSNFKVSGTHIYQHAGNFPVVVTIEDAGGANTATPPILATVSGLNTQGANLTYTVGVATTATVATFSDTDGDTNIGDYGVVVAWGDGSVTNSPTL